MYPISDGRFGKELAVYLRVLDIALSQLGLEFSDNYNCPEVAILRGLRSDRRNCSLANRTPIIRNPGRNGYVSGAPQQPETCYETRGLRKYGRYCFLVNRNQIPRGPLLPGNAHSSGVPERPLIRQGINGSRQYARCRFLPNRTQILRSPLLPGGGRFAGFLTATFDFWACRWLFHIGPRADLSPSKSKTAPPWCSPEYVLFGFSD